MRGMGIGGGGGGELSPSPSPLPLPASGKRGSIAGRIPSECDLLYATTGTPYAGAAAGATGRTD
jgi:hypothetical protein